MLIPLYLDPQQAPLHTAIRQMWSMTHFAGAEPLMIEELEREERYWSAQTITNKFWDENVSDEKLLSERTKSRERILNAVEGLGSVGSPEKSIPLLQKVWERWRWIELGGGVWGPPQPVKERCKFSVEFILERARRE